MTNNEKRFGVSGDQGCSVPADPILREDLTPFMQCVVNEITKNIKSSLEPCNRGIQAIRDTMCTKYMARQILESIKLAQEENLKWKQNIFSKLTKIGETLNEIKNNEETNSNIREDLFNNLITLNNNMEKLVEKIIIENNKNLGDRSDLLKSKSGLSLIEELIKGPDRMMKLEEKTKLMEEKLEVYGQKIFEINNGDESSSEKSNKRKRTQ